MTYVTFCGFNLAYNVVLIPILAHLKVNAPRHASADSSSWEAEPQDQHKKYVDQEPLPPGSRLGNLAYAEAQKRHRANQVYVRNAIQRLAASDPQTKAGQRARNTARVVASGYKTVCVLTQTHDPQERAAKNGHPDELAYFGYGRSYTQDAAYNWKNVCDTSGVAFASPKMGAASDDTIYVADAEKDSDIDDTLQHEVQHTLTHERATLGESLDFAWERYKNEFAAYWPAPEFAKDAIAAGSAMQGAYIEPYGDKPCAPYYLTNFKNFRQQRIFAHMIGGSSTYSWLAQACLDANFFARVEKHATPQLQNVTNSQTIDQLYVALQNASSDMLNSEHILCARKTLGQLSPNDREALKDPAVIASWFAVVKKLPYRADQEFFSRELALPKYHAEGAELMRRLPFANAALPDQPETPDTLSKVPNRT